MRRNEDIQIHSKVDHDDQPTDVFIGCSMVPSFCWFRLLPLLSENAIYSRIRCHSSKTRNDGVNDDELLEKCLSSYNWPAAEDTTGDYVMPLAPELELKTNLKARSTHLKRISNGARELLEKRRIFRLDQCVKR